MLAISLPNNGWMARNHQINLWNYLLSGGKRAIAVWHRRAGKDEVALHFAAVAAMQRPGNYWHALPEYQQARKSIWNAVNPHTGVRRIDEAFPLHMRTHTIDDQMMLRFVNGSTWQLIGSDRYDAIVGSSPAGIVWSEFALSNPSAWAYCRPMLEENDGWSLFISTPRGRNHCKTMFDHAMQTEGWFAEIKTVHDTHVLSDAQLDVAQSEYRHLYGKDQGDAHFSQEYECSWNAATIGAFYTAEMAAVRHEGRVTDLARALPGQRVNRAWDLGMRDDTAIWFHVSIGSQVYLLHCLSVSGASLETWRDMIEEVHTKHGWEHGVDIVPHDAKVRELGTGRTRVETMIRLGLNPVLGRDASKQDGINAVRRLLPLCVFHPRCEEAGLAALEMYRREWDDEKKAYRASEVHDWTSHPADAFRYLALNYKPAPLREVKIPKQDGWHIPPPPEDRGRGIVL
jgi:hypothetical protein